MVVVCTIDICSFMLTSVSLDFHSKPVGPVVSSRSILYSPLPYSRNLYEEGKVCLSILGTWAGDRSESWSPSRSSLLQALVSIQGLVLVKEPYVPIHSHSSPFSFFFSDSIWGGRKVGSVSLPMTSSVEPKRA